MTSSPLTVSVVVPTYNRADLLPATLDAILGQTLAPHEVIVVDDGSTDATAAVLQRYAPRVQAIRISNSGDMVARNVGLQQASGILAAFCDSDDLWRPSFLATVAALWRQEPALRAAYGNFNIIRDDVWDTVDKFGTAPAGFWTGLREAGPGLALFDQPFVDRLVRFQPFFPSAMAVDRRSFLAAGGWDEVAGRGRDFATALRVAECPPVGVIQAPLVGIRKHAGNFSADVQKMNLGDACVLEHALRTRPALAPLRPLLEGNAALRRQQAFDTAFARGDYAGAASIYDLLPAAVRSSRVRIKRLVAGMPAVVRDPVLRLVGHSR